MRKMANIICLPWRIFCECQWDVKIFICLRLLSKGFFRNRGASVCNSLVMILKVITDENKLTALLLKNLWLSECAVIALLKNERAPVILHWRCQNWKYHYTFPVFQHSFSFSFLLIINLQCTSLLDEYGYTAQKSFTIFDDSSTLHTTLRSWIDIWFSYGAGDDSYLGWGNFCLKK